MEFYTVYAKDRLTNENDHREGPFTLTEAQAHLANRADCDYAIIVFMNHEWYRIEWGDDAYFCKPLNDINAYWEIFDYREEQ